MWHPPGLTKPAHALLRHYQASSCNGCALLRASSVLLSHGSSCLLIAHGTPLRNSVSNLERDFNESRFHSIINRDIEAKRYAENGDGTVEVLASFKDKKSDDYNKYL
jgi:hypothetical protein